MLCTCTSTVLHVSNSWGDSCWLNPVLAGLMSVRRNLFHAFDSIHAHHENTKLSVHSEAQAHLTSTMGRKGGDWKKASELVDWHAPQPPWFSSDEEDLRALPPHCLFNLKKTICTRPGAKCCSFS